MEPPEQKKDADKEEKPPDDSTSIIKGHHNQDDSTITTDKADKRKKDKPRFWRDASRTQKTQIILALLNLLTLLSFILINSIQIGKTNKSLDYADSTNVHTRESIELAKRTADSSDRNNKRLIALNENSIALVKKNLMNTEMFSRADIRAYIAIDTLDVAQFEVAKGIKIRVDIKNVGKTPASQIGAKINQKFAGTGIYEADFKGLKSFNNTISSLASGLTNDIWSGGSLFLTREDSIKIQNGEKKWHVFGIITYRDIFGNSDTTRFGVEYDHTARQFFYCGAFNEIK